MPTNTGTVGIIGGSDVVNGVGTLFTKEVKPGDTLYIYCFPQVLHVAQVINDTSLTLTKPIAGGRSGQVVAGLLYFVPEHFSPVLGLPLPTPNQLRVQIHSVNRALQILDVEIP